jgi:hypothetical protein
VELTILRPTFSVNNGSFTIFGWILYLVHNTVSLLLFVSFTKASISDPGFVQANLSIPVSFKPGKKCQKCKDNWKPPRAHHCKICDKCVFRMDHHCQWINNCVGYSNQKFFILFLFYLIMLSISNLILIILNSSISTSITPPRILIHSILSILSLASIYLGYEYLSEQLESIETNISLIETFQNSRGSSDVNVFTQLFGSSIPLWFRQLQWIYRNQCSPLLPAGRLKFK